MSNSDPPGSVPLDGRVVPLAPKRTALDKRHVRLLRRMVAGDAPRCSSADFERLWAELPGLLQRESRYGADTRGGYVLTPLHKGDDKLVADWLRHNLNSAAGPAA